MMGTGELERDESFWMVSEALRGKRAPQARPIRSGRAAFGVSFEKGRYAPACAQG